jgi:hypothetical protein
MKKPGEYQTIKKQRVIRYTKCIAHKDSGLRCLVAHTNGVQCKKCSICGEWY